MPIEPDVGLHTLVEQRAWSDARAALADALASRPPGQSPSESTDRAVRALTEALAGSLDSDAPDQLRELAKTLEENSLWEHAAGVHEVITRTATQRPSDWRARAEMFSRIGQLKEAYLVIRAATERHPGNASLWHARGGFGALFGAPEDRDARFPAVIQDAIAAYHKALELDATLYDAALGLGALLARVSPDRAGDPLSQAMKAAPDDPRPCRWLGEAALRLGDGVAAEQAFREALRRDPDNADALAGLAAVLIAKRSWEEAVSVARRGVRQRPLAQKEAVLLGNALHGAGDTEAAIATHRACVGRHPTFLTWWRDRDGNLSTLVGLRDVMDRAQASRSAWLRAGTTPLSLLFTSRGRPDALAATIQGALRTASAPEAIEVVVMVDDDDPALPDYIAWLRDPAGAAGLPPCQAIRITETRLGGQVQRFNLAGWVAAGDLLYICADDLRFGTEGWDTAFRDEAARFPDGIFVIWAYDGLVNAGVACHPCVSRVWRETLGYVQPPVFDRGNVDVWVTHVARAIGRDRFLEHIQVLHDNPFADIRLIDATTERNETGFGRERMRMDALLFNRMAHWRDADIAKLRNIIGGASNAERR